MKRSTELKQEIANLKNSMTELKDAGKITEAHAKLEELNNLKRELEVEETLEAEEAKNAAGYKSVTNEKDEKYSEVEIFNKLLFSKPLTESEREFANNAGMKESEENKGGVLVPKAQETTIKELRRKYVELKNYCNVIKVDTNAGTMPMEVSSDGKLIAFDELTDITKTDVSFTPVEWKVKDYGAIIPISRSLAKDEKANLFPYIGRNFSKRAVRTENSKIIELVKTATAKTGKDYKDIIAMLTKELDPAVSHEAIILTNQSGLSYLETLEDKQGRPLLSLDLQDETKPVFKGREVVVVSDVELPSSASTKYDFYIGSLFEFVSFFDREGVEVEASSHSSFSKNAIDIRAIERFDTVKVDDKAMVKLTITPTA